METKMKIKFYIGSVVLAGAQLAASPSWGQSATPLKIGVMSDQSGMTADFSGPGSVASARMAVEDFGGRVLGRPIEISVGDHLNKPDTGLTVARQWYDNGVSAIFDVGLTSVALGVQDLAREKNKIVIYNSTGNSDMAGKSCSPNGIQWTYNSYALATGSSKGVLDSGGKTWYFITVDYGYGKTLQRDATEIVEKAGGKVIGSTTHPFASTEFSSQLLQAQASKADVVGLATTTIHMTTMLKQAEEFGIRAKGQKLAPLGYTLHDAKALGLASGQGLLVAEPFYWDQNDETRKFATRYKAVVGKMPNMNQASVYGAVTHYLKAVAAAGTADTAPVMAKMKATRVNDFMTKNALIREDGQVMRDLYVFRIKKPSESKNEWDLYSPVSTLPAEQAFRPADKQLCTYLK
jgi:branched-chain amino acid transport system substrate-binding protein